MANTPSWMSTNNIQAQTIEELQETILSCRELWDEAKHLTRTYSWKTREIVEEMYKKAKIAYPLPWENE